MKLLVLCHGNINRSPLCAAIINKRSRKHTAISAGFVNPDKPATKKMREAALALGYDLAGHRSKLVTQELVTWADRVILMDLANAKRFVAAGLQKPNDQVHLLGEWATPKRVRVPDPAFMKAEGPEFTAVVQLIEQATLAMCQALPKGGA